MNGIDILLQQAIVAAFFWVTAVMYVQQKWRILDAYFGKKYARLLVTALFLLVWLQVCIVAGISVRSTWQFEQSLVVGTLLLAWAMYLLFTRRQLPFAQHRIQKFRVYMRQHLPFILLFLGLGYATGGLGLLLGAITYTLCAIVHAALLSRLIKHKK